MVAGHEAYYGPLTKIREVASCRSSTDGKGPSTHVDVRLSVDLGTHDMDVLLQLRAPGEVDELIQLLLRHKRDVWPDAG